MFKKLIIGLMVVFALILGGVSAYVSTIDWNKHKDKIAQQFENVTGKKIVFEGNVSLSVFPSPYLTAKNIKIYNQNAQPGTPPLAVINELVTDLSLMPLLKGNFIVNNMSLVNPNILIEVDQNGHLNWDTPSQTEQSENFENIDVALNSVMLKDASVQIINPGLNTDIHLQNLNAEVTAQSIKGPYRIDGNFVKDNNPAGFALTLGTLSDSFATSLNLVLTHPTTESYARFDGSMLMSNNEINGNFIVESKKPSTFLNSITNQMILPEKFNYPLAVSVELKTNKQQIDLSSFIVKYGNDTAGAGNILIPLRPQPDEDRRKIEANFEMTDLDLQPIEGLIKERLKKYDSHPGSYQPNLDFDLTLNIKSLKALYNGQSLRNFNLNASVVDNAINIKNLSALLPGDTDFQVKGDIFEKDKNPAYNLQVKSISQDFLKFINWLNIKPQHYKDTTYRNALIDFGLSGNLQQIKIYPVSFKVDNTSGQGVVGIIRGDKTKYFVSAVADSVMFDNYVPWLNDEQKQLPLADKAKLVLNKFSFLNGLDLHFDAKINSGSYNQIPFEQLSVYADIKDGTVSLQDFSIVKVAASSLKINGAISGLGNLPTFSNLKYELATADFSTLSKTLALPLPQLPLIDKAQTVNAKGIFTGDLNDVNIKAVTAIDKLNSVYGGRLYAFENKLNFKGNLEFKTPNFTDFVRLLGFNYQPQNMPANIFTFEGSVTGNTDNWKAENLTAFVGTHNFKGSVSKSYANNRPVIDADITANKFEFDRFIYNPMSKATQLKYAQENADFLKKPIPDKTVIDYDFFKTFDMHGKFKTDSFNYGTIYFDNLTTDIDILQGVINAKSLKTNYKGASVDGQFNLNINDNPKIVGKLKLGNFKIDTLGGKRYSLNGGMLRSTTEFDTSAASVYDFISQLNGKISFDIDNTVFKGWNLAAIEQDLEQRTHSDNLFEFLRDNLQTGETPFELVGAEVNVKNGSYSFKDGLMASSAVTIDFVGNGSLKDWTTDTSFLLVFEQLRDKILPIEFLWKGSLNAPNLVVDATALKNKYDDYWAKIAKEKREAEQARIKALNEKMATLQEKIKPLKETLTKEIFPKIEQYKPLSSNSDIKSRYDSNHLVAIDINNQLDMMIEKAKKEFTEEEITEMNAGVDSFVPQLNDMIKLLDETFAYDVKMHAGTAYNNIKSIYDNAQTKAVNYQKTLDAYVLRLLQLGSLVVLDRDPKASDYKNQIETSLKVIEDINSQANTTREAVEGTEDINELNRLHNVMKELDDKSQKELAKLNTSLEELFAYTRQLVREEEDAKKVPEQKAPEPETKITIIDETVTNTQADLQQNTAGQESLLVKNENNNENNTAENVPVQSVTAKSGDTLTETLNAANQPSSGKVISYSSKLAPSGTITKGKQIIKTEEKKAFIQPQNQTESLLKPITDNQVAAGGTITKKR